MNTANFWRTIIIKTALKFLGRRGHLNVHRKLPATYSSKRRICSSLIVNGVFAIVARICSSLILIVNGVFAMVARAVVLGPASQCMRVRVRVPTCTYVYTQCITHHDAIDFRSDRIRLNLPELTVGTAAMAKCGPSGRMRPGALFWRPAPVESVD